MKPFPYWRRTADRPKWTDYANVACTIGLIFVAYLQLRVFKTQAQIFDKQLKEMQSAGPPAQQSADAASKFSTEAESIRKGVEASSRSLDTSEGHHIQERVFSPLTECRPEPTLRVGLCTFKLGPTEAFANIPELRVWNAILESVPPCDPDMANKLRDLPPLSFLENIFD